MCTFAPIMKGVKIEDLEIMAPVGSYESLTAAIQAGAGSIYFGIENLNMRSRSASNFTTEDLFKIVQICKQSGLKSYLTLNTVIYNEDLSLMRQIIDSAKCADVSAIIASDVAAMQYACQIGVEVHLSTQLNISNIEALRFYAQFADVVVLARELNLNQVAAIYHSIESDNIVGPKGQKVRIEMFCHGALCMAVSGKCYLSLHQMNASANRGSCLQMCRRGYTVKEKEGNIELDIDNQYIMSPKDLKTIHFLNKMVDAGVRVFKIEGRARGGEYVKAVVSSYKQALEAYVEGRFDESQIQQWERDLSRVFNRGFWDGYYLGQKLGEWSHRYGSQATHRKQYIGKALKYFSNIGVAEFLLETGVLHVGDEILITGPTTGALECKVEEIRVAYQQVSTAVKGDAFSIKVDDKIRPSDKIYRWVEEPNSSSFQQ